MMAKRPLLFAAIFYLTGILLGEALSLPAALFFVLCIPFVIGALLLRRYPKTIAAMILIAILFAGMGSISSVLSKKLPLLNLNSEILVEGRVADISYREDGASYRLSQVYLNGRRYDGKVVLTSQNDTYQLDDTMCASALLRIPERPGTKYAFDDFLYCASQGIGLRGYALSEQKTGEAHDLLSWINACRTDVSRRMDALFADQSSIAKALVLGEDNQIFDQTRECFNQTGISHILSVSGLHVSVIVGAILLLLAFFRAGRLVKFLVPGLFVVLYAVFTGGKVPVVRAAIMTITMLFGRYFFLKTDSISSLALAFLVLAVPNPAVVFDVGFQLSFGAVFSMICIAPVVSEVIPLKNAKIRGLLGATIAVNLGTLPIIVNMGHYFWLPSLIVNIVAILYASFLIPYAALSTVLYLVFGDLVGWLGVWGNRLIDGLEGMAAFSQVLPDLGVTLPSLAGILLVLVFLCVLFCSRFVHVAARYKRIVAMTTGALVAIAFCVPSVHLGGVSIEFLDTGYGNAAVITAEDGTVTLVNSARGERVCDYLIANGIYPAQTILTELSEDAVSGLPALQSKGRAGDVYALKEHERILNNKYEIACKVLNPGGKLSIGGSLSISVLSAGEGEEGAVLLQAGRRNICLFTGDASAAQAMTLDIVYLSDPGGVEQLPACPAKYGVYCSKDYADFAIPETDGGPIVYNIKRQGTVTARVGESVQMEALYAGG